VGHTSSHQVSTADHDLGCIMAHRLFTMHRVAGYCLHPLLTLQALTLLIKYVFVIEPPSPDSQPRPAQASSTWLPYSPVATLPLPSGRLSTQQLNHPLLCSPSFSPPVQAVSRKVYRLLRRTFAQWQPSSSASLSRVRGGQREQQRWAWGEWTWSGRLPRGSY
jgi:hypothetical protein